MTWPNPESPANQAAFAAMVGVSQQAISQLKLKNVFPEGGTYAEWLHAYLERLRTEASGRDQDARLSSARIRETEASANLKDLDYLQRLKKIILFDDVAPMLNQFCSAVQFNVLAAQEKIIDAIESKYSITLDDDEIAKPLRDALESVAGSATEFIARLDDGDEVASAD